MGVCNIDKTLFEVLCINTLTPLCLPTFELYPVFYPILEKLFYNLTKDTQFAN